MAIDNTLLKGFVNFKGLDLRSSDLERPAEFASELENVEYRKTGAMSKRKGYHGRSRTKGGYGISNYSNLDITNGQIDEQLVTIDDKGYVLKEELLTITYTGIATAFMDIYLNPTDNVFYADIYDDNVLLLHRNLGLAVNEASPPSIADLITDINALTDFSAAASGSTAEPAAFLNITRNLDLTGSVAYEYWEEISTPTNAPTPFTTTQTKITEEDFENASFVNIRNIIYISTGYNDLYKYDGVRLYKAGLPSASIDSVALGGAGAVTATNIQYKVVYEYTDAKGNFITGIESDLSAKISPSSQSVDITVDNILDTTGFDTDSADLKIRIYRNRTEDSITFYEVGVVTNDGTSATQIFNDNTAINSEGVEFIDPIKPHGLPPKGKYLAVHQGLLMISGDNDNPNTVYYSDIDSPEFFPPADNSFLVETTFGDSVTGIAPLGNAFFVFKHKSIHQIAGSMFEDIFRVDLFGSARIGCLAHNTIAEVNGFLLFLSDKGVYAMNQNENSLQEVSDLVEQRFSNYDTTYNKRKATAMNWIDNDKYIINLPENTGDYQTSSTVMAYDYFRQAWLQWSNINAMGGFALKDNCLYFQEREFRTLSGNTEDNLYIFKDTGDTWDYADHASAIPFTYKSHWEALQEPSVFKKFTRCRIHSLGLSQDDFESDSFSIRLRTELDYFNSTRTDTTLDFSGSTGGWGIDPWGEFAWGATRLIARKTKLRPMKSRSLRLILSNDNIHENVLVSGYEFEVATPYRSFIKE